jgi:hypothetical protein
MTSQCASVGDIWLCSYLLCYTSISSLINVEQVSRICEMITSAVDEQTQSTHANILDAATGMSQV